MDDYFQACGLIPESPTKSKKPTYQSPDTYIFCEDPQLDDEDGVKVEEREAAAVTLLLKFLELDRDAEVMREAVESREKVRELRREICGKLREVEGDLKMVRNGFEWVVEEIRKRDLGKRRGGNRSVGGLSRWGVREVCHDKRCKGYRKEIRRLEKEKRTLENVKEECEKRISYLATADPRYNLQERFELLDTLFTRHKRYPSMEYITEGGYVGRIMSEDSMVYDSTASSSDLEAIADRDLRTSWDQNGGGGEEKGVLKMAARLLSQLQKLLRDTNVAKTNFRLAIEAFKAAQWQLKRIPTSRIFDTKCCDDNLFNSRIDTVKRHFVHAKQYVVKALRFAGGAQLLLDEMSEAEFENLFSIEKIAVDPRSGLKKSVLSMRLAVGEALEVVNEAAVDLDLFRKDAKDDRDHLTKAMLMEQERVVEYRTALIYEHVLKSGTLAKRIVEHPTSCVADPTGKSENKRVSHRNVQLQRFDE